MAAQITYNSSLPIVSSNDNGPNFGEMLTKQTDVLVSISKQFDTLTKNVTDLLNFSKQAAKREDQILKAEQAAKKEAQLENKSSFMGKSFETIKEKASVGIEKTGGAGGILTGVLGTAAIAYFASPKFKEFVDNAFSTVADFLTSDSFKKTVSGLIDKLDWVSIGSYLIGGWRLLLANTAAKIATDYMGLEEGSKLNAAVEAGISAIAFGALLFPKQFWGALTGGLKKIGTSMAAASASAMRSINPEMMVSASGQKVTMDDSGKYRVAKGEEGAGQFVEQKGVKKTTRIAQMFKGKGGLIAGASLAIAGTIAAMIASAKSEVENQAKEASENYDPKAELAKSGAIEAGINVAGMALTGAQLGMIFGPLGAAIGAGIGGLVGIATSIMSLTPEQKDAMKAVALEKWNNFKDWIGNIFDVDIASLFDFSEQEKIWNDFVSKFSGKFDSVIKNIMGIFDGILGSVKSAAREIIPDSVQSWLPDSVQNWLNSSDETQDVSNSPDVTGTQGVSKSSVKLVDVPVGSTPMALDFVPSTSIKMDQALTGAMTSQNPQANLNIARGGDTTIINNNGVGNGGSKSANVYEPQTIRSEYDPFMAASP